MTIANKFARRLCILLAAFGLMLGVGVAQAQTVIYYHTDALGSPVATTNAAGVVIERTEYEPYGQVLNEPVTDGPGYAGHVSDAQTGLSYMQQRYYDPLIGRFLSMDPVTADASTGSNFNRYWYANNNPYLFTDPDGRQSIPNREQAAAMAQIQALRSAGNRAAAEVARDRTSINWKGIASAGTGFHASKNLAGNASDQFGWIPVGQGMYTGVTVDVKVLDIRLFEGAKETPFSFDISGDIGAVLSAGGSISLDPGGRLEVTLSPGLGIGEHTSYSTTLNVDVNNAAAKTEPPPPPPPPPAAAAAER